MGNQIGIDQDYDDSDNSSTQHDVTSTNRAIFDQNNRSSRMHRSSKHSKSHVRLIPLSGSPNTSQSIFLPNMSLQRSNVSLKVL